MNIIIFTGAPATGKSSIANECSKRLKIPAFSKDGFKVQLFERYGFKNHSEKKKLSIQGEAKLIDTLSRFIANNQDIIIDNNFKHFNDVRRVIELQNCDCNIICFYLFATYNTLADRYNERIRTKKRELSLYVLNQYPVIEGVTEYHKPLDAKQVENIQKAIQEDVYGDTIIRINTETIEDDFEKIVQQCIEGINKNRIYKETL